jgi:fructose-1,6-bisphosphatase/inositol monophosphatase family enzyme
VVATDAPHGDPTDARDGMLGRLVAVSRRTRMFGSVCCALAWVAAGRLDLYYGPRANLWDMAAGALLVHEAGGDVRSGDGTVWTADASSIVAGNAAVVEEFLDTKSYPGITGAH